MALTQYLGSLLGRPFRTREELAKLAIEVGMSPKDIESLWTNMIHHIPPPSMQGNVGASAGANTQDIPTVWSIYLHPGLQLMPDPQKMLLGRLRRESLQRRIADNVHVHVGPDKTHVIVFPPNGEPVTLVDETSLFPSDKLVVSMQMLIKAA